MFSFNFYTYFPNLPRVQVGTYLINYFMPITYVRTYYLYCSTSITRYHRRRYTIGHKLIIVTQIVSGCKFNMQEYVSSFAVYLPNSLYILKYYFIVN